MAGPTGAPASISVAPAGPFAGASAGGVPPSADIDEATLVDGEVSSDGERAVVIAGGVGAAPIVGMLRTLADRHEQRPLWFIDANNRWDDVIFREELDALQARLDLRVIHVLTQPPGDWRGESGFVTPELLQKHLPGDAQQFEYFLCGPKPMSEAVPKVHAAWT